MRTSQMLNRAMRKLLVGQFVGQGDGNDKRAECDVESARRWIRRRGSV